MNFQLVLMRHAEAKHNKLKESLKKDLSLKGRLKESPFYNDVRFHEGLMDCSITEQGF